MSYTDLRDFEPEATYDVPQLYRDDKPLTIQIAKSGGGTVGESYAGTWRAIVTLGDTELYRGQDLDTGTPKTHEQAARVLADYVANGLGEGNKTCDRLSLWSGDSL